CTFALTLAITSTYLMHSNNQILGDIDQRALTSVVGTGIYPLSLMFSLLTFLAAKHVSAFTYGMSIATWIWSLVIARRAVGSIAAYRSQQSPVVVCGAMTLPEFCGRADLPYKTSEYFSTVFLMVPCCLFWPPAHYADPFERLAEYLGEGSVSHQAVSPTGNGEITKTGKQVLMADDSASSQDSTLEPTDRRSARNPSGHNATFMIFTLVYFLLFVGVLAVMIRFSNWISHMVKQVKGGGGFLSHEWTFGQIVSLMLWLPPVLEIVEQCCQGFFYLSLALSKRGVVYAKIFVRIARLLKPATQSLPYGLNDVRDIVPTVASFYRNWRADPAAHTPLS
ncbi:hypothetical protein LTR70_003116, partial [Exophiala xenobiotica]